MIEIQHIDFSYKKSKKKVYKDFTVSIEEGGIYGLLGRNGTGKSTLLYLICGLLNPSKGTCTMDGINTSERRVETLRDIFIVPEEFELPATSLENYVNINKPFYPHFSEDLLYRCLESFNMEKDIKLSELSMGMKKKVFISFALATQTRLLLMDEPTNGLDIPSKSQFRKTLALAASENRAIVISTHQVKDLEQLLDQYIIIEKDGLLTEVSAAHLLEKFRFDIRDISETDENELYSRPSYSGKETISLNTTGEDTPINLDLLFNALIEKPELSKYLNDEK